MEILIIIVLVIGGWLFYNSVDKLNKYVAWLNKEIQTKVREIDGMMKIRKEGKMKENCVTDTHKIIYEAEKRVGKKKKDTEKYTKDK